MNSVRSKLIAFLRSLDVSPDEADDLAQEALLKVLESTTESQNLEAFAITTAKNLWIDRGRKSALHKAKTPTLKSDAQSRRHQARQDETVAQAGQLLRLAGAMEQLAVWGNEGSTGVVVSSALEVDLQSVQRDVAFFLNVLDGLPYTDRHRRNKKKEYQAKLQAALQDSGYLVRRPSSTARAHEATGPTQSLNEDVADKGGVQVLTDYYLVRGSMLARRFCAKLRHPDAVEIARKARNTVFGATR